MFFQENAERAGGFQAIGDKSPIKTAYHHGLFNAPSNVNHITRIRTFTGYQAVGQRGLFCFGNDPLTDHAADFEDGIMSTRRKAYWWFWFVASGRFLETFLNLRGKRT